MTQEPHTRLSGWENKLAAYIEAARHEPFAWGRHDCALWAALWVKECTGDDFATPWLGRYSTAKGAALSMRRRGYDGVDAVADAHLAPRAVGLARRGDLVSHPADKALGICAGRMGLFVTLAGLTEVKTLACPRAWAVG